MSNAQYIASGWVSYARANGLKPNTKKYAELQHAYLNGTHVAMMEEHPPILTIYAMTGRDIADLVSETIA